MSEQPGRPGSDRPLRVDVELVPEQTADDTDAGWGEGSSGDDGTRWYREQRPPHHGT